MIPYRAKRIRKDLEFGAADTAKSVSVALEGVLHQAFMRVPNFTNVVTATLTIQDEDGFELFNSGAKAKGADYLLAPVPELLLLAGKITISVTLSGVPGGDGGTVSAVLFLKGVSYQ